MAYEDDLKSAVASGQPLPGGYLPFFSYLESKYALPQNYLSQVAQIESPGYKPDLVSPTGATGLFQFTQQASRQVGLPYEKRTNPILNAEAAAKLAAFNQSQLSGSLGRPLTAPELYLAHQQGAGGAFSILSNPDARVSEMPGYLQNNIKANNGTSSMTLGEFFNKFAGKFDPNLSASPSPAGPFTQGSTWLDPSGAEMGFGDFGAGATRGTMWPTASAWSDGPLPPPRPQFENEAFNTPSEDTGRGTKPTLLDDLNAQPAYGGVHDPNLGVSPTDVDTTGSVSDPNDYTRRVTEALMEKYMPGEYGRKNQTTPAWAPEPGAADGWTLDPSSGSYKPDTNFGLPDINPGRTGYPYGKGMDFGLPDMAGNPEPIGNSNYMSYNDQYKLRTGQDYYNPYYEATKAQQTYADGAYDGSGRQVWGGYVQGNDGLWVQPTPGGQTHTLDDILPNGIPTSGPGYKYGTGMDFGLPDINNVGAEGRDGAGRPIWGGYVQDEAGKWMSPTPMAPVESANNPNNVGGNTNTIPDWQLGDTGFGGGNIGQQPAYTDPTNPTGFSSANVSGGVEPAYFSDMGTSIAPINYAAGSTGGTATLNLGGGTSPGFGGFGMGSTGTTGGFDPGDMGDAATTQGHTDYMNSARALDAFTAKQQADAVAQRNATDASIANAYAISNSYNPQYNGQTNFNNNVANLNNPLPYYSYSFL